MAALDTAPVETIIPAPNPSTPDTRANGRESSPESQPAENIDRLRMEIRQMLIIFTNDGRGRRLIEHGSVWKDAMNEINRLSLSNATDQKAIEALGDQAKAIFMEAWKTNPNLLTVQTIQTLRTLIAQNPAAQQLIREELRRIGKEHLAAELMES